MIGRVHMIGRGVGARRSSVAALAMGVHVAMGIGGCTGLQASHLEATGGDGGPHASLIGEVDTETYCNTVGIIEVQFRARRIGCDPESTGPCTLPADPPDLVGDRQSCPITDATTTMGVDVTQPGVYQVESAGIFTTGPAQVDCFAPVGTPAGGAPDVTVYRADVEEFAQIVLQPGPGPCPVPP